MKAIVCAEFAPPENLTLADLPDLAAGPGEVVVDIVACGANYVDALLVQGLYQVKPPLPYLPGSEIAGIVSAIGEGVDGVQIGDEVVALVPFGGFATQVKTSPHTLIPKPPALSFEQAAAFLMTYCTASYALDDIAQIKEGEQVLVLGAGGGVGLACLDLAVARGAKVIAAASTPQKRALCEKMGAAHTIDYDSEDLKARVKELGGADIIVDPVGGDYSEIAFRTMNPGGRHLIIGFAAGSIPRIPVNLALLKRAAIMGVDWGGHIRANPLNNAPILERVAADIAAGRLTPHVSKTYPLAKTGQAMRDLLDRKVTGKAVVLTS